MNRTVLSLASVILTIPGESWGIDNAEVSLSAGGAGAQLVYQPVDFSAQQNHRIQNELCSCYPDGQLTLGRPVRIIRDPYFGQIGSVSGLPAEPQVLDSGSKARVLEVRFDSGESVVIPRANVELIEG